MSSPDLPRMADQTGSTGEGGLGTCAAPWCDRDAVVYIGGPTYGPSPRLVIIGGLRAIELAKVYPLGVRCLDCTSWALDEVALTPRRPSHG